MIQVFDRSVLAALVLFVGIVGQTSAGSITYSIQNYPADQNGTMVSGTLTTDGIVGDLAATDVLSWSWTITPRLGTAFTLSSSDAGSQVIVKGSVVASLGEITIDEASSVSNEFVLADSSTSVYLYYARDIGYNAYLGVIPTGAIWATINPVMDANESWIIATASVPEPSSLTLLGIASVGLTLFGRRAISSPPARQG